MLDEAFTPERTHLREVVYGIIDRFADAEARHMEWQSQRWWLNDEHGQERVDWPLWRVLGFGAASGGGIMLALVGLRLVVLLTVGH